MNDNIIEAKYNITKKSRIKIFYYKYKASIYISASILVILFFSLLVFNYIEENKKISLAESYLKAKIHIQNNDNEKAIVVLKNIIFADDKTYSPLALFSLVNKNLIIDKVKISALFDHVLKNNRFKDEIRNLILFKRALIRATYENELQMLEAIKPIIRTDNVWKPHALLLMGDYFFSKKEYIKSKEFYNQILSLKNLQKNFYFEANSRLALIKNEK